MRYTRVWKSVLLTSMLLALVAANSVAQEAHHWGYSGETGPNHWAEVSPVCKSGHAQSPINITHAEQKDLPNL